jgi:hypothetical protein
MATEGSITTIPDPNNPGTYIAVPVSSGPTWDLAEMQRFVTEMVNEAVAHLVAELDGMTQRCEELEIELEIEKNSFHFSDPNIINPKRRGNW